MAPSEEHADGTGISAADDGQWEDYTCVTPWEEFIRSLEDVLREWKGCDTGAIQQSSLSVLLLYSNNSIIVRVVQGSTTIVGRLTDVPDVSCLPHHVYRQQQSGSGF